MRAALLGLAVALSAAGCAGPVPAPSARWREPPARADWRAAAPVRWQWQLTGPLDLQVDAEVYALDVFSTPAAAVTRLHRAGRRVICHVPAGQVGADPDADRLPAAVRGAPVAGRPGAWWLDIRAWEELRPVLADRLRLCRDKGFDAVVPSGLDGYAQRSGFPLTDLDQLSFNRRVAALARQHGLAVGLRGDQAQARSLEPDFDFAVSEDCLRRDDCAQLEPFVLAGKLVLHVEYDLEPAAFCPRARAYGFVSIHKRRELDAYRSSC